MINLDLLVLTKLQNFLIYVLLSHIRIKFFMQMPLQLTNGFSLTTFLCLYLSLSIYLSIYLSLYLHLALYLYLSLSSPIQNHHVYNSSLNQSITQSFTIIISLPSGAAVKLAEQKGIPLDKLSLEDLQTLDPKFEADVMNLWSYENRFAFVFSIALFLFSIFLSFFLSYPTVIILLLTNFPYLFSFLTLLFFLLTLTFSLMINLL